MTDPIDESPRTQAPVTEKKGFSVSVGQVLAGILLVLAVIFIAENNRKVRIRFIFGAEHNVPVWIALFGAAVLGALIAALMRLRRNRKTKA